MGGFPPVYFQPGTRFPNTEKRQKINYLPDFSKEIQNLLEKIYRNHPDSALVCEMLTDLDEGLQEWRYRHVQMVRRTIGTKSGSGGSSGVDYLKGTLMKPLFPDLWAIRNRF